MAAEKLIEDVSDTARWVAFYRAMESERPDAHFRDPFARRLAGERGREIVRHLPDGKRNAWALIVRTVVIDEIIMRTVRNRGVDTVVNLAAGLDTRPYRLDVPPELRWIEVDLPEITGYKENIVQGEKPRCRLERVKMDLADVSARQDLFARINKESREVLVITEGFLIYLETEHVIGIAKDLRAQPRFRWWVMDYVTPAVTKYLTRKWGKTLSEAQASWKFFPSEGPAFFHPYGYKTAEWSYFMREARRLHRAMPGDWMVRLMERFSIQQQRIDEAVKGSGVVLLERAQ
jgi:methyltransferase (TIGR00027 family)